MKDDTLPDIGTKQQAREKLIKTYLSFLDLLSKFLSLCDYYQEVKNYYKPLSDSLISEYSRNLNNLKGAFADDICYEISKECVFYLDFVDEIEENLNEYFKIIDTDYGVDLDEYDLCCDILAVRDEFIDLMEPIEKAYESIMRQKKVIPHVDDPLYDPMMRKMQSSD